LINKSIDQSVFPEKLKAAQVSPLFKKNNSLDKSNYCPISVDYYHWFNTSANGLLVPESIIHPVVSALALAWFVKRYPPVT
jgi:hypothetical protein